jgi:hypothetical protein
MKMGRIGCPETSVENYHWTLRTFTEERRSMNSIWTVTWTWSLTRHGAEHFVKKSPNQWRCLITGRTEWIEFYFKEDYLTGSSKVTVSVAQSGPQWWREVLRRHSGVDPSESSFTVLFRCFYFPRKQIQTGSRWGGDCHHEGRNTSYGMSVSKRYIAHVKSKRHKYIYRLSRFYARFYSTST